MSRSTRSKIQKYLGNVAERARKHGQERTFARRRLMVLHALRQKYVRNHLEGVELLEKLSLPFATDVSFGVIALVLEDGTKIIFANNGEFIGKDFAPRKKRTTSPKEQLLIPSAEILR